jgi:hypothetical protein
MLAAKIGSQLMGGSTSDGAEGRATALTTAYEEIRGALEQTILQA